MLLPTWSLLWDSVALARAVHHPRGRRVCVLGHCGCVRLCVTLRTSAPRLVHGPLQARTLEWAVISTSRRSSQPRDRTWVSCIAGRFFTI